LSGDEALRKKMGDNAAARAMVDFSLEQQVSTFEEFYARLLQQRYPTT